MWEKQKEVFEGILNRTSRGIPVALLFVLESKGSSPGRTGFSMLADSEGDLVGSIGGGIMEHKLVETARSFLEGKASEVSVFQQVHSKASPRNQSGMICSGEQMVWIRKIDVADSEAISRFLEASSNSEPAFLRLSPEGLSFFPVANTTESKLEFWSELNWRYWLQPERKQRVFLAGGGHCALALSRLLSWLGYEISIIETRPDLNTLAQNIWASKILLLKEYSEIQTVLPEGEDIILISMTFGYRTDDLVIRAVKGRPFRFLGILGSKAKIRQMMEAYQAENWDGDWLSRIHAPVGLPISSQTPEEIAVSIAAELIQHFRKSRI